MTLLLSHTVKRLHQLAWQPGAWIDTSWWTHLQLANWEAPYGRYASCRRAIDATIVTRRGFPKAALPSVLNERQCALLDLEPRLYQLTTALGLIALDCPEYLLLRDFRETLSAQLGARACEQLFILHHGWKAQPALENHMHVGEIARQRGTQWLSRDAGHCAVSHGLLGLLPHSDSSSCDGPINQKTSAQHWLLKLGRFL